MRHTNPSIVLAFTALLVTPISVRSESWVYKGFCEASAAVILDASHVAIASDDFDAILTYERGKPSPVKYLPVGDVTDIEAAARIRDVAFWLTSHSLNSSGHDKTKRKALFATKISANGSLSSQGATYRNLRADIAKALGEDEKALEPRLNIEGMADTPDGHLLLGLRGPLAGDGRQAILLEVANPLQLVSLAAGSGSAATVTQVTRLDLSEGPGTAGRGVRDIVRIDDRYLIVAGSEPDGGQPTPKLFWWDGHSDRATPGPDADFAGMTPEAVVAWSLHDAEVFSDNGGAIVDGVGCDDKETSEAAFFPSVDVRF